MNKGALKVKYRAGVWLGKYLSGESIDFKQIIAIIIPIFVDQVLLVLMSLVNTAMISSSGVAAVSAVSMVDSLNILLVNIFVAVATGGTVMVAQYKGRENTEMVSKTATQAISAVTLISVLISALVIAFNLPILNLLFGKAEADVFQNAKIYLIGSCLSYPLIAIFQAVNGALRGVGQTKPCLTLSLIMNITNTILNVVFITVLHMGIIGLIVSIILARAAGMAASLIYILRYNDTLRFKVKNALHLNVPILKKVMYIGLPFAAEQVFFSGGKLLTQTFIVQLGTFALTANAIGNSLSLLFQVGPSSLTIAIVTVVGQCIGRRDIQDARKLIKSLLGLSSIVFVLAAAILLPAFPFLIKMFSPPDEIVPTIYHLMILCALVQPIFWAPSFVMPAALRAAGDSSFTSVASLLTMWLLRVGLGYVLGITLGWGIIGVWVAMVTEWGVRGFIFLMRFKGEKWYAHKLV